VHRDLKPENILLHEHQPLVMDFGIALAVSNAGGERLTQMGISFGTPQYMSPEQATGDRVIDARSDIYSLGVVLYEMLAGAPPHAGNSVQAVIAKVIMDRPTSVRATRELVPEHVDVAIACALAKLPADRYASASDFARALTGEHALVVRGHSTTDIQLPVLRSGAVGAIERVLERPVTRRVVAGSAWMVVLGAAAAAGAAGALAWYAVPERPYAKFPVAIPDGVSLPASGRSVAISPDGSQLAVVGVVGAQLSRLWTRPMAGVAFGALYGTDAAQSPTFSPDGKSLLYVAGGRLMKVSSAGGAALPLADSTDGQHSWGEGDVVVFTRRGDVWSMSAGGGSSRLVARADSSRGVRRLRWPEVLPGGTHALITIERTAGPAPDSNHIGVLALENGKVTDLDIVGTGARFAAPGHVMYATADGSLWAVPFSPGRHAVTGAKILLASDVNVNTAGAVDVAVSATGTVVYGERSGVTMSVGSPRVALTIVDDAGARKRASGQVGDFLSPRVSPDAARIALTVRESVSRTDVWIYEISTGQLTPMTRDAASQSPEWADARRVVFRENPERRSGRYVIQPWDHSAEAQPFLAASGNAGTSGVYGISLGPPAGYLALTRTPGGPFSRSRRQDIHIAPMGRPTDQKEFVNTDASELSPRISPNGRWLAYTSNESGTFQVYVLPVPGPGPRVPVSINHGIEPVWSRDGRTLYYVSRSSLLAAHVDESSGFRVTRQDTLFNFSERGFVIHPPNTRGPTLGFYDVFPNGDFAVLSRVADDSNRSSLVALLHWQQLLKARNGAAAKK
jgi:serine/threonine-protein kinase